MSQDWICYAVSGVYATLLLGCVIGIRKNLKNREYLILTHDYVKNAKVIVWKTRFYSSLFCATLCRIAAIIGATILNKKLLLSKAENESEFLWQIAASLGSMLYFSSFSLIIWFFAQISYHQRDHKELITIFIVVINVLLYCSTITLAIADFITSDFALIYEVELPFFSACNWILSFLFVFFSCKIAQSVEVERRDQVDYHIEHSHSGHPSLKQNKFLNNPKGITGDTQYIVPRLMKLSILCAVCWIVRGVYTMILRIRPNDNLIPIEDMEPLAWEAVFFCLTEYPPSLGALFLMILKPTKKQKVTAESQDQYPQAVDYHGVFD